MGCGELPHWQQEKEGTGFHIGLLRRGAERRKGEGRDLKAYILILIRKIKKAVSYQTSKTEPKSSLHIYATILVGNE